MKRIVKCCKCKKHFPIDDTKIVSVRADRADGHPICWFICKKCEGKEQK